MDRAAGVRRTGCDAVPEPPPTRAGWWAAIAFAAAILPAGPAAAGPGDADGARGLVFARRRDCKRAVPALEAAEERRHKPRWAVALADCYVAAGDLLRAGEIYRRVAADKPVRGWLRIDFNAVKAAKRKAAEVEARIPTLRFRTSGSYDDLAIEVDGKRVDDPDVPLRVAPDVTLTVTARAPGRRPMTERVVLNEGERRLVLIRLDPLAPAGKPSSARAPAGRLSTSWLGARYYGAVIPRFVMNLVADGGTNLVVPGGAFTFTTQVGGDPRSPGQAGDVDLTVALGYQRYRMGDTPFKPHGEPDTEWEIVGSSLQALTATLDVMWGFPLDAAGKVQFRVGGAVGLGWMFTGDLTRVQSFPASGKPGDPSTYLPCKAPGPQPGYPFGTFRYCNTLDKDASHYPGYTEPDWFHGGIRPSVFPWLVLPQLGLSFHPSRSTAIDLDTGVSLSGFLTSLGFRVGL